MESSGSSKVRWGQNRRLNFIDVRLQYDGRINRSDLMQFFDISAPQASADLGLYQQLAGDNLVYDTRQRIYLATPEFKPITKRSEATRYLNELQRLARGIVEPDESFVGYQPSTGVVVTPSRAIEADEVATLLRAIRDRVALRVRYQSMDAPEPQEWVLSPHALGFDGLRWHARAWCHARQVFRDFAIGRLDVLEHVFSAKPVDPLLDEGWNNEVTVSLVPHPGLTPSQRRVVMRDYGMVDGHCELRCRKAMLFYTLRHLNLESLAISDVPAQQHVVVENAEEVKQWMREDRDGLQHLRR
ncbi:hypothetical protein A7X86_06325 [Stenotrophomonas maltophilia]|nr:hypothetical protein A7X86_06325 [Stenotrophomonas maltophilia]